VNFVRLDKVFVSLSSIALVEVEGRAHGTPSVLMSLRSWKKSSSTVFASLYTA